MPTKKSYVAVKSIWPSAYAELSCQGIFEEHREHLVFPCNLVMHFPTCHTKVVLLLTPNMSKNVATCTTCKAMPYRQSTYASPGIHKVLLLQMMDTLCGIVGTQFLSKQVQWFPGLRAKIEVLKGRCWG
jgi:hypothetical protein